MEGLILLYYLRIFSFTLLIFLFFFCYLFFIKEIKLINSTIEIKKNQSNTSIVRLNISNLNYFESFVTELYFLFHSRFIDKIHYGKFVFSEKINLHKFLKKITNPSNFVLKITIVEGWNKNELDKLLKSNFDKFSSIEYNYALADTYFLHSYENFDSLLKKINNLITDIKKKYNDHELLKKFSFDEIVIIGSLLEKEGIDDLDKKIIFSVIQNRLNKNMKLQIDATTIYAITEGKFKLNRKLSYKDLEIKHPYNTYFIYGLPPTPISYVGKKTIELIFENYKSNYLFYFYNNIAKKHIYSETFIEHKRKLSEYRDKK